MATIFQRALEQLVDALEYCKIKFSTIPEHKVGRVLPEKTIIVLDYPEKVHIFFNSNNYWTVEQFGTSKTFMTFYLILHILSHPSTYDFLYTPIQHIYTAYISVFNARVGGKMMELLTKEQEIDVTVRSLSWFKNSKNGIEYSLSLDNGYWYVRSNNYSKKIEQNEFDSQMLKKIHDDITSLPK